MTSMNNDNTNNDNDNIEYRWVDPNTLKRGVQPFRPQSLEERESLIESIREDGYDPNFPIHVTEDWFILQGHNRQEVGVIVGCDVYVAIHFDIDSTDTDAVNEFSRTNEIRKYIGRNLSKEEKNAVISDTIRAFPYYTTDRIAKIVKAFASVATVKKIRDTIDPNHVNRECVGEKGSPRKPLAVRKPRAKEVRDYGIEHLQTGIRSILDDPESLKTLLANEQLINNVREFIEFVDPDSNPAHVWNQNENGNQAEEIIYNALLSVGLVDQKEDAGVSSNCFAPQRWAVAPWGDRYRDDFVVESDNGVGLVSNPSGGFTTVIEVRSQTIEASSAKGRNLETWHKFLGSDVPNCVLVVEGDFWLKHENFLVWLESQEVPAGKTFTIVRGFDVFDIYANKTWT